MIVGQVVVDDRMASTGGAQTMAPVLRHWVGTVVAVMVASIAGVLTLPVATDGEWLLVSVLLFPAVTKVVAHSEGSRPRAMYTTSDRLTIVAVGISFLAGGGSEVATSIALRVLVAGVAGVVTSTLYFVIPAKAAKLQASAASDRTLAWLAKRAGWLFGHLTCLLSQPYGCPSSS